MKLAPHAFTLRQLQYVLAVADALSFRKAAERCHVSQPALSAQLAQLEGALGVRLFERDRRRVLPTAAGSAVIERVRRLVRDADDLVEVTRQLGDPLTGTLRVGVIPTVSPYLLPSLTPALHATFPRLQVHWVEDRTAALVTQVEAGGLDAALLALEAPVGELARAVVAHDAFVLVTPRAHPLGRARTKVTPAELHGAAMLLLDDGHCFRDQALAFCARSRVQELGFRATSLSTLAQMVAAGAGVTLLPELAVATEAARAGLRVRHFVDPAPRRTLALVWRAQSPLATTLAQIAATMRAAYPAPTPPRRAAKAKK